MALLEDGDLHADIFTQTQREFRTAAERGRIWEDKAPGFLFRVIQRTTWRLATKRANELLATLEPTTEANVLDRVADPGWLPDDRVDRTDRIRRIQAAIRGLEPRDRELIDRRLDGESYEQIAPDLGRTVSALRKRHHDIIARLKSALADDEDPDAAA